jgi:Flp pilus assembly pilin Flp
MRWIWKTVLVLLLYGYVEKTSFIDDGRLSMFLRIGQLFNNRSMARAIEYTVIAVAIAVAIVAMVHGFGDSLSTTSPSFALK